MFRQTLHTEKDGVRVEFDLVISDPKRFRTSKEEYYCDINAPGLFDRPKQIHGEGKRQAKELAIRFVNMRLSDIPVYNAAGRRILSIDRPPR